MSTGCRCTQHRLWNVGWQYKGSFIKGKSKPFGQHDLGAMWECPFLTPLEGASNAHPPSGAPTDSVNPLQLKEDQLYMMCVSPYPHFLKDRLTNPCLYWLGYVKQELFMIEESDGEASYLVSAVLRLTQEHILSIHQVLNMSVTMYKCLHELSI